MQQVVTLAAFGLNRSGACRGVEGIVTIAARKYYFLDGAAGQVTYGEGVVTSLTVDFELLDVLVGEGE